ncbi:3-isopropylmalate dehydratase small subunit [Tenuifilum thalassicum]|uniref:3-isopropylmalate dehydratase small subunit n=1 Tax=Tenuifilum thalassicum TaxID=2590900 RepID=A0A7D3XFF9_9BACT|nr:3-isopropylmalate dehydratase small subunit [Tenuifilum thalassicum]QKG79377.1 3-isopropylmalate dehydratase small subunit [Tenuifilum thalassicum]
MAFRKFTYLESTCIPLPVENVDTDQIIPARFLNATTREGFGEKLFYDWRFLKNGTPNPDFILNNKAFSGSVLVVGTNFGCGSSREHAVWALTDYGFRVVISSFFADIFKNNALNNGLLPIVVSDDRLKVLLKGIMDNPRVYVKIDLEKQLLQVPSLEILETFEISPWKKECLLKGLDDVDYLLRLKDKIVQFEKQRAWL